MFHVSERKEYQPVYQIFKSSNIGIGIDLKNPTLALFSNENLKDALFLSLVVEAKLMHIKKQKVCSENNMKTIISIFNSFG